MSLKYYQEEIETASREQITAWQNELIVRQVKHAYDSVPYYRDLLDRHGLKPEDIRSIADIGKLPFISKEDLRTTYPDGFLAVPLEDVIRVHATNGTTGKRVIVYYTKQDIDNWEDCMARNWVAAGIGRSDVVQNCFPYGLHSAGLGLHGACEKVGATVLPMSAGNTALQLELMVDMKTTTTVSTASYAAHLAEMIEERGLKGKLALKVMACGGEPLTDAMRKEIERRAGVMVCDNYGITEMSGPGVSFECVEQDGMHVQEDHYYAEIIDPQTGEVLPDGAKGELVLTALTQEAFPLIRFRTRDICVLTHEKCKCGRTFVRMSKPMGRTDDMLSVKGDNVFPTQIETVLIESGLTSNFEIVLDRVKGLDRMTIRAEMLPDAYTEDPEALAAVESRVRSALKQRIGVTAIIELLAPKTLKRSPGKAVHVIDNRGSGVADA